MIRHALAAAVLLLSIPLHAAARSDAAFAAALPAPSFEALAGFKTAGAQKPAEPKTIVADPTAWKNVLEAVKNEGKYEAEAGIMPGTFSIEDSTGDPKANHVVRAISALGTLNDDEKFELMGVVVIFKEIKIDPKDGKRRVDLWMFQTDVYGEVEDAAHMTGTLSQDGTVLATPENPNLSDPKVKAQFDAMIKYWAERKPKGA